MRERATRYYHAAKRWGKTAAWLVVIALCIVVARQQVQIQDATYKLNHSVCTLRTEYAQRIADSKALLDQFPNGIHTQDGFITAAQIKMGLRNTQRTAAALRFVDCPADPG